VLREFSPSLRIRENTEEFISPADQIIKTVALKISRLLSLPSIRFSHVNDTEKLTPLFSGRGCLRSVAKALLAIYRIHTQ
jgi:hypothetical protein